MKTKTVYLKAPFQFEVRNVELAEPGDAEALVRVTACAICGSDLNAARADAKDWQPFGHEVSGVVERVGASVTNVKPGDAVVLESGSFCGRCEHCRNGRVDLCRKAPHFWLGRSMGFSEYMLAPMECLVPYSGISPEEAALVEPLGVSLDLLYTADVKLNDDVLVAGVGPLGLMAVRLARAAGARRVFATARSGSAARIALARQFGADEVFLTDRMDAAASIAELGGVDKLLVTTPPDTLPGLIRAAKLGAVVAFIGFATEGNGDITFDANAFHVKRLQLRASLAAPALYFPRCVDLIKTGVIDARTLISHRFRLEDTGEAMRTLRDDKANAVKMVMVN